MSADLIRGKLFPSMTGLRSPSRDDISDHIPRDHFVNPGDAVQRFSYQPNQLTDDEPVYSRPSRPQSPSDSDSVFHGHRRFGSPERGFATAESRLSTIAGDVTGTAVLHQAMREMEIEKNNAIARLEDENGYLRDRLHKVESALQVAVKALDAEAATASYLTHAARKRDLQAMFWHWRCRHLARQRRGVAEALVKTYAALSTAADAMHAVVDTRTQRVATAASDLAASERDLITRRIRFFADVDASASRESSTDLAVRYLELAKGYAEGTDEVVQRRLALVGAYLDTMAQQLDCRTTLRDQLKPLEAVVRHCDPAAAEGIATMASRAKNSRALAALQSHGSAAPAVAKPAPSLMALATVMDVQRDAAHASVAVTALPPLMHLLRRGIQTMANAEEAAGENRLALVAIAHSFFDKLEQTVLRNPLAVGANHVIGRFLENHVRISGDDSSEQQQLLLTGDYAGEVEVPDVQLYIQPLVRTADKSIFSELVEARREHESVARSRSMPSISTSAMALQPREGASQGTSAAFAGASTPPPSSVRFVNVRQPEQVDDDAATQLADAMLLGANRRPLAHRWEGVAGFASSPLRHLAHVTSRRSPQRAHPHAAIDQRSKSTQPLSILRSESSFANRSASASDASPVPMHGNGTTITPVRLSTSEATDDATTMARIRRLNTEHL